jgi:hypothetical protein
MGPEEKRFFVGISVFATLFGIGGYVVFQHAVWGWAFIIAGLGGFLVDVIERARASRVTSSGVWAMALILTWGAIGYDIYERHHSGFGYDPARAWDDAAPLERIYNPRYISETVVLDGKHFINPTFDGGTLLYQGTGGLSIEHANWVLRDNKPTSRVATRNKIVANAFLLYAAWAQGAGCKVDALPGGPNENPEIPRP